MPVSSSSAPAGALLERLRLGVRYISPAGVAGLRSRPNRHAQTDESRLSALMQPFWNAAATAAPPWVSANVITLVGLAFPIVAALLSFAMWDAPFLASGAPFAFVHLLNFVAMFVFQTADAVDGKHARRTHASSSLGDFLDHNADLIAMYFAAFAVCGTYRTGIGVLIPIVMFFAVLMNFFVFWETGIVGQLVLRDGSSITESQFFFLGTFLISFLFGSRIWDVSLLGIPLGSAIIGVALLVLPIGAIYTAVANVARTRGLKTEHAIQCVPVGLLIASYLLWIVATPVLRAHPYMLVVAFVECYSIIVGRHYIWRLTDAPLKWHGGLYCIAPLPVLALFLPFHGALVFLYFLFVTLACAHFFVFTILEFAEHLNIPVLSVPAH